MAQLNHLELAVLEKLLEGPAPALAALREQLATTLVSKRELTGVGFFTYLQVSSGDSAAADVPDGPFGDVEAQIEGLQHGAGFLLWIKEGRLSMLEGFSYDEPWPEANNRFTVGYQKQPRDLTLFGTS